MKTTAAQSDHVTSQTPANPVPTVGGAILMGGSPATKLTSMSLQNSTNCPGARIAPSQVKVLLLAP